MPSLVAASSNLTPAANDFRAVHGMSDGRILVLFTVAGTLSYKTSTDGVTWSSVATAGTVNTVQTCTRNGDTLYLLNVDGSGNLQVLVLAYAAATLTSTTYGLGTGPAPTIGVGAADAVWDSGNNVLHIALAKTVGVTTYTAYVGAWSPTSHTVASWNQINGPGSGALVGLAIAGGTIFVLSTGDTGITGIYVSPVTYSGAYSMGSVERVTTSAPTTVAAAINASNQLVLVYSQGGALYTLTRTGTGVYTGLVNPVPSGVTGGLSLVPNGNDLLCFYESVLNQANGEIILIWRQSGSWGSPVLIAGGDASGYTRPKAAAVLTGGSYDIAYAKGGDVYYGAGSQGHAPDAPTITAPSGPVGTLTPTIIGTYSNSNAPADGQSAVEYKVVRNSDSAVMWNSGWISDTVINRVYGTGSATGDPDYSAPIALSYGVLYTVSARVKDSVLLPTQASSFSTGVTFTPYQAGTSTLTHVVQDGTDTTSSPVTIDSPTITSITASWSQPQTHDASQYRDTLYEADGITINQQTSGIVIAGNLASGASLTSPSWVLTSVVNHGVYKLTRAYLDATSGLWNESTPWTVTTLWTPPAAPTGLTAIPHPELGYTIVAWTNDGAYVSVVVQRAPTGTTDWVTLPKSGLFSTLNDWAPMGPTKGVFDYQVYGVDASGTPSTPATVSDVMLGANGDFGVSVVDLTNMAAMAWFGAVDQWEDATNWEAPDDVTTYRPLGSDTPIETYSLQNFVQFNGRQFLVPNVARDATGTIIAQAVTVAMIEAIRAAHNACLYRDIDGSYVICTVKNLTVGFANDKWPLKRVKFDVLQIAEPVPVAS